jgi:biopolymer transport protein ExbB
MSNSNHLIRWTVAGRWIATVGIGLVVALGYAIFQPAHAQDRGPQISDKSVPGQPAAAANSASSSSKAGGGNLLSPQEKAANDLSVSEPEKKENLPAKEADTASILRDIKWLSPHMWAFYAIWVVSIIAVSFAVERFLGLRRSKILPADLDAGLRALASRKGDLDLRHAQRLCKQYPSAAAAVVRAMLAKVGRPLPEIEQAMTEACEHEATRLYANVRVQNLAFNVAPMLGLAGTVHGMILCFYTTAHMPVGENKMDALATGIYAALICTLAGLVVAIPAGILAHSFEGRILKLMQRVEDLARSLVPHLERFEGRPRQLAPGEKQPPAAAILEMPRDDDDLDDDIDLDNSAAVRAVIEKQRRDDDLLPAPKPKKVEGRP